MKKELYVKLVESLKWVVQSKRDSVEKIKKVVLDLLESELLDFSDIDEIADHISEEVGDDLHITNAYVFDDLSDVEKENIYSAPAAWEIIKSMYGKQVDIKTIRGSKLAHLETEDDKVPIQRFVGEYLERTTDGFTFTKNDNRHTIKFGEWIVLIGEEIFIFTDEQCKIVFPELESN